MFAVISGTRCANVVSIESTCSTRMFLSLPDDILRISPKGILNILSAMSLRISFNAENVALCDIDVEIDAKISFNIKQSKILPAAFV